MQVQIFKKSTRVNPLLESSNEPPDPSQITDLYVGLGGGNPNGRDVPERIRSIRVGDPPERPVTFTVDAIQLLTDDGSEMDQKERKPLKAPKYCLILDIDKINVKYIVLDDLLSTGKIKRLSMWINGNQEKLVSAANEYEEYDRQLYHFMYDMIGMFRSLSRLSKEDQERMLSGSTNPRALFHNHLHADILRLLQGRYRVEVPVERIGRPMPDLMVDGISTDVKTILVNSKDRDQLLRGCIRAMRKNLKKEDRRSQVGVLGTFFVGFWSSYVATVIFLAYKKFKSHKIFNGVKLSRRTPEFSAGKVIFVLPTGKAFVNDYLAVDRSGAMGMLKWIQDEGFPRIRGMPEIADMIMLRSYGGFPFCIAGTSPSFYFKIR